MGESGWKGAFNRVQLGEKPSPAPEGLRVWTQQTVYGLLGGSILGGIRGLQVAKTDAKAPVKTVNRVHRSAVFFVQESILTGARVGLFVSLFSALVLTGATVRKREDAVNYAVAGSLTCGLFGGSIGGWAGFIPAAMFGGAVSGGGGFLQQWLVEQVADSLPDVELITEEKEREHEITEAVNLLIEKYEEQLEEHPSNRQEAEPK